MNFQLRQAWAPKPKLRPCKNKETVTSWHPWEIKYTKLLSAEKLLQLWWPHCKFNVSDRSPLILSITGTSQEFATKAVDKQSISTLDSSTYGGLLNKRMKTYVECTRENQHNLECSDVKGLREWERSILKRADDKYDLDDDSSDEEAIAYKKEFAVIEEIYTAYRM